MNAENAVGGSIAKVRKELEDRLVDLRPYHQEYLVLERTLRQLDDDLQTDTERRRRPLAERKAQVQELVREHPGIKIARIAEAVGLSVPRVVQIVNQLEEEERLRRTAEGLVAAGEARRGETGGQT